MKYAVLLLTLFPFLAESNYLEDNLRQENWGGVEVVWLEDDSYPVYDLSIYFQGGAYSDAMGKEGETAAAFELLTAGTDRYKQNEILDALDFYGASYEAGVTHEFVTYNISGLAKDAVPTMKMVCHLFRGATYPEHETAQWAARQTNMLANLPARRGALANRIFRQISLEGTGYERPVGGTLESLSKVRPEDLKQKLAFFNESVKKRVYIKGPKQMSKLKSVLKNDCKWGKVDNTIDLPRAKAEQRKGAPRLVYLAASEGDNQAQIRTGNFMTALEAGKDRDLNSFASTYVGGGFTSRLMQKARVERGLTYSIGAYASEQANYGRKGVNTSSALPVPTLQTIDEVMLDSSKNISDEQFAMSKRYALGSYLMGLESTSAFLSALIYYDHLGRDYKEIYEFRDNVMDFSKEEVQAKIKELYDPAKQIRLVVGDPRLKEDLEKAGYEVRVIAVEDYL